MKSILIIGLGAFGRHLCRKFMSLNNEVMIVDRDEAAVTALADEVTSAQIADCTDENAARARREKFRHLLCLHRVGFASSLLITSMLKDMGAARVVAGLRRISTPSCCCATARTRWFTPSGTAQSGWPPHECAERVRLHRADGRIFHL